MLKECDDEAKATKNWKVSIKISLKRTLLNYKDELPGKLESLSETQYTLRANKLRIFLEKQIKKAQSPNETKRNTKSKNVTLLSKNKVSTVPWGFNLLIQWNIIYEDQLYSISFKDISFEL